jgi:hypothetical protein
MRDHPSDDVPAENIEDDIKVKVGPLDRSLELGDIPGPHLVGGCGQEFGFLIMIPVVPPSSLFDIAVNGFEDSVHGPDRTMITPLIQERGIDFMRRLILESFRVQDIGHFLPFSIAKGQGGSRP